MSELPIEVGNDEVQAHPRRVGHRWFDITMAVCAIFISAVSLVVAIEHGRTERDLVAASSWPFLRSDITNAYGDNRSIEIGVSNGGVGPAKIRSYEMVYHGHPVGSPMELLSLCCGLPTDSASIWKLLPQGTVVMASIDETVLRPGETNTVLIVSRDRADPIVISKLEQALYEIEFRACYCSTLDQCWVSDLKSIETQRVASCPAPAHPYVSRRRTPEAVASATH